MAKKKILIVDDEKTVRKVMAEALKSTEHRIDIAENGLEAIRRIGESSYDLIITDYLMPKIDGLELVRRIRSQSSTPIIVVTSDGPVHELLNSGAMACIVKPFDLFELQDTVKTILNKRS